VNVKQEATFESLHGSNILLAGQHIVGGKGVGIAIASPQNSWGHRLYSPVSDYKARRTVYEDFKNWLTKVGLFSFFDLTLHVVFSLIWNYNFESIVIAMEAVNFGEQLITTEFAIFLGLWLFRKRLGAAGVLAPKGFSNFTNISLCDTIVVPIGSITTQNDRDALESLTKKHKKQVILYGSDSPVAEAVKL